MPDETRPEVVSQEAHRKENELLAKRLGATSEDIEQWTTRAIHAIEIAADQIAP